MQATRVSAGSPGASSCRQESLAHGSGSGRSSNRAPGARHHGDHTHLSLGVPFRQDQTGERGLSGNVDQSPLLSWIAAGSPCPMTGSCGPQPGVGQPRAGQPPPESSALYARHRRPPDPGVTCGPCWAAEQISMSTASCGASLREEGLRGLQGLPWSLRGQPRRDPAASPSGVNSDQQKGGASDRPEPSSEHQRAPQGLGPGSVHAGSGPREPQDTWGQQAPDHVLPAAQGDPQGAAPSHSHGPSTSRKKPKPDLPPRTAASNGPDPEGLALAPGPLLLLARPTSS